jgi:formiminotetrahydrofolate cyclodeaminase
MAPRPAREGYLDLTLGQFLDRLAAREPAPGGGAAAAVTVAMAAGLVAMAARFSGDQLEHAEEVAAEAEALRLRVAPLAQADADAYGKVLEALALPRESSAERRQLREETIRRALEGAADVPLTVAEIGANVAELAETVARSGNPNLRGDAVTAGLLAAAGVRSTARLVAINVGDRDERTVRAERLAGKAAEAARRAATAHV